MSSAGGLQKRSKYRAIDSLLSGPAAGVVGAGSIAKSAGLEDFINLDMGGTSTDVSRYSGNYGYQSPHQVGDARIASTALKIETVAAGGGSICRVENGLLRVGPESAGAHPGPACYGFGGPLCLTDINLLLGSAFPG
jgi:5-oxoprolinase (ATP-hydrolysing)